MARAHEYREEEGAERREEGYAVGMPAEQLLGQLDEPVHAARSLEHSGAGDGGHDYVDDVRGRGSRLHPEAEYEHGETDA